MSVDARNEPGARSKKLIRVPDKLRHAALSACLLLGLGAPGGAARAQPADAVALSEGIAHTASHAADTVFDYSFEAAASHSYLVVVEQQSLDLVLTLKGPRGAAARSFDSPLLRDEREVVLVENARGGRHALTVRSNEHTGAEGAHSIRVTDLSDAEEALVEGWRALTRGAAANFEGGEAAWSEAVSAYEAAADSFGAHGATREEAQALFAAATIEYWQHYDWARSAELARRAAALYDSVDLAALAASARHLEGAALVESALETTGSAVAAGARSAEALLNDAFALFEEARGTFERLGRVYDLALVTNNIGYAHYNRGDLAAARARWEEAAGLMRRIDEWSGELGPLGNLAAADADAGRVLAAIEGFRRVLELLPAGSDRRYRADTMVNLGISQLMFGNADEALEAFDSALAIQREIDDLQGRGRSERGIGRAYHSIGRLDLAKTYLSQALPIAERTNDGRTQEGILRDLGNIAYLERDYERALALHREALDIVQSAHDEAYLELLVAKDLLALDRHEEAGVIASRVRAEAEGSGSALLRAEALHELGRAEARGPDPAGAVVLLERAGALYDDLGLQARHAEVLHNLARAESGRGRLERAAALGDAALDALERVRLRLTAPEMRAYFSGLRRDYYESQMERLIELDKAADGVGAHRAALETSERARARMITDLLEEAAIAPAERERAVRADPRTALYERLAELGRERDWLLERETGAAAADDGADIDRVVAEIAAVENELNLLEIRLRRERPELSGLEAPAPLDLPGMQALLDDDSVLLQYAFTSESAWVWVVTPHAVEAVELGARAVVESAARRVLDGFASYAPGARERGQLAEDMRGLAALVLAPALEHVEARRIVLSLDGPLHYVPFAALPVVVPSGDTRQLLESHRVVRVPSMSALAAMRRRGESAAEATLAVFADPVLGPEDPRLASATAPAAALDTPPDETAVRAVGGSGLVRLPWTGYEAEAIAALVPETERFVARGFGATRESALDTDLRAYRYVHFATHGIVDARQPALSGLALSHYDEQGSARDGMLRLHDVYKLRLDADLVVLSACETALGREIRGEGLVGLSQGFMYAGARGLIASLWQVPDRATSELMTRFYGFLIEDGMRPAEALRRAQLEIAGTRRWSDPYFWGGFILLGDW
jgi:CHAT domain-containing protein/tetratricopeptide (TPR) repeat protein